MRKCQLSCVAAAVCSAALLFLVTEKARAEDQPGGLYRQPPEDVVRKLLNVARKACRGVLSNPQPLLQALNLSGPLYFYLEEPGQEVAHIPVRYCPEPSPSAEFVIGRVVPYKTGPSFFYRTSALTARPIAAARSFFDRARNDIVYEPIAVTKELQDSYNALSGFLMNKW